MPKAYSGVTVKSQLRPSVTKSGCASMNPVALFLGLLFWSWIWGIWGIKALRQANIYEAQSYRHVLGAPRLIEAADGGVRARTSFIVVRIMHAGETMLFATGRYEDRIVFDGDGALFAEKTVIIDSRQIDTLLAIPL